MGTTRLGIAEGNSPVRYGVTSLARRQLADKLKIPYAYFERVRYEQPVWLDRNVDTWLQSEDDRRMLHTLDGNVRAVLSDRCHRLDNFDLTESVLPTVPQGIFIPLAHFEQRATPPALVLRALAKLRMLAMTDTKGSPTLSCEFNGSPTVGLLLDPRLVEGLDLDAFVMSESQGA